MHDIFVSYAHDDKPLVRRLVDAFEKQGWSVWWDDRIQIGTKYSRQLDEALAQSRCVVACWTRRSLDSEYVLSEAHRGEARHILVQIQLEAALALPGPFNEYSYADLTRWPDEEVGRLEFQKLLNDLAGRLTLASTSIPVDTSSYIPGFKGHPAVAVLPLVNKTGKPEVDYIADAVSEDIIDRLQRFRSIPVISSNTTMNLGATATDLDEVARRLGVTYIVTGNIRLTGSHYRIRVELTKQPQRETIWSTTETIDSIEDASFQEEVSLRLAAQLPTEIERSERKESVPLRSDQMETWHLVRQGIWHQYKLSASGAERAKQLFDQAIARDPDSIEALVQLAWWHFWDASYRRGDPNDAGWSQMEAHAQRAANIDPSDARPVTLLGIALTMRRRPVDARKFQQQAINLNPSYAWAYAHMGTTLYLDSDPEGALVYITKAVRLSPLDFFVFHAYCDMATSYYMLRNYSSALDAANFSLAQRGGYWLAHVIKICTLVRMGRQREAEGALEQMQKKKRNISQKDIDWIGFSDPRWNVDLGEGLREAGKRS